MYSLKVVGGGGDGRKGLRVTMNVQRLGCLVALVGYACSGRLQLWASGSREVVYPGEWT